MTIRLRIYERPAFVLELESRTQETIEALDEKRVVVTFENGQQQIFKVQYSNEWSSHLSLLVDEELMTLEMHNMLLRNVYALQRRARDEGLEFTTTHVLCQHFGFRYISDWHIYRGQNLTLKLDTIRGTALHDIYIAHHAEITLPSPVANVEVV